MLTFENIYKFIGTFAVCCVISGFCLGMALKNIEMEIHHDIKIRDFKITHEIQNRSYSSFEIQHKGIK